MNDDDKEYYYQLGYNQAWMDAFWLGVIIAFPLGIIYTILLNFVT